MDKITRNQNTPKRAVIYARTANKQFRDNELCLQKQFDEIQQYAEANDIEIVERFYDLTKSARNGKRAGLQKMISFAASDTEQIDYVIVQSISRLSRDTQSYFLDIKSKLEPAGVHVRSITERFDETPGGQFMQMIHISQAQWYSDFHRKLSQKYRAAASSKK